MKYYILKIMLAVTYLLQAGIGKGVSENIILDIKSKPNFPIDFILEQNYPNPFNPTTIISYRIPKTSYVKVNIFDVLGNDVATLVNEYQSPNNYRISFNAANLSNGVYYYKITANNFSAVRKMILLK